MHILHCQDIPNLTFSVQKSNLSISKQTLSTVNSFPASFDSIFSNHWLPFRHYCFNNIKLTQHYLCKDEIQPYSCNYLSIKKQVDCSRVLSSNYVNTIAMKISEVDVRIKQSRQQKEISYATIKL